MEMIFMICEKCGSEMIVSIRNGVESYYCFDCDFKQEKHYNSANVDRKQQGTLS